MSGSSIARNPQYLLKTAQKEYVEETRMRNNEPIEEVLYDNMSDNGTEASEVRADLTVLGVDLDDATISRLESNLGGALFNTASKAAQTIRVCGSMRSKKNQTPMGHLVDESSMNMKFLGTDVTDISMVTSKETHTNVASPATVLPKSMRMSASFHENSDHFIPLASGVDLETSMSSNDQRKLFEDDETGSPFDVSEMGSHPSEQEEEEYDDEPSVQAPQQENNSRVDEKKNYSLDYYRKKRSIFKTDLNEILGSDDDGFDGSEERKDEAEHDYLNVVNIGAAFSIEPEMRSQLDKLLIAMQIDYMNNPDKFMRRLFDYPLNAPRVNMSVVNNVRFVGEMAFFEAMRRVMRSRHGNDDVMEYDRRMENELIHSLYQLVVESKCPRGEKERRPVVDLWNFVRKLKTGDRLRGETRSISKEEGQEKVIRCGFHKYDKTNAPLPVNARHVNALDREVASRNAEIEEERKDNKTTAWRNRSPPRNQFSSELSMYDLLPRPPRKDSMLQVLNYEANSSVRCPIDDDYHTRKATNLDKVRMSSDSHLVGSRLIHKECTGGKGHEQPVRAHRRKPMGAPPPPLSERTHALPWEETAGATALQGHIHHKYAKSDHGYVEKSTYRARQNSAFNSCSVADALHGKADDKMQRRYRRGAHMSHKAITEINKSGKHDSLKNEVNRRSHAASDNIVVPEKKYLQQVNKEETTASGAVHTLLTN